MPRKLRELIRDLERAGFIDRGGKGEPSKVHASGRRTRGAFRADRLGRKAVSRARRQRCIATDWKALILPAMPTAKPLRRQTDRYMKIVEWSDEDGCYLGRCPELFIGRVHGGDRQKVYAELCDLIDEWTALLREDGTELPVPFSGKDFQGEVLLRLPPELHRLLAVRAIQAGDSLNAYCRKLLERPA